MIIGVTGEGPTDYGKRRFGTGDWEEGPVQVYIRRILNLIDEDTDIEFREIEREDIQKLKLQRSSNKLEGKAIVSRKFVMLCKNEGIDKGVYYTDSDRDAGVRNTAHEAIKRYEEVYQQISDGLDISYGRFIPMIPIRMIENWMLGDANAICEAIDAKDVQPIRSDVEFLWGSKNNPQSDYPKNYLTRYIEANRKKNSNIIFCQELACDIANRQDLNTIGENCKNSFLRFRSDCESLVLECGATN